MPAKLNNSQVTIEKTPKYFVDMETPFRLFKTSPRTKLILVLRNPITRAISEFLQSQSKLAANRTRQNQNIAERFARRLYTKNQTIDVNWPIIRNGIYYTHLKRWLRYFSLNSSILVVNGEKLIREPFVEMRRVEKFLGIEHVLKKRHFVFTRRKRNFACILNPMNTSQVSCLSEQKGREHPKLDQSVMTSLQEFYEPFNRQLFSLLNEKPWW